MHQWSLSSEQIRVQKCWRVVGVLGSEGGSAASTHFETLNTSFYVLFTHVSHWDFEAWDGMGYATALKDVDCS